MRTARSLLLVPILLLAACNGSREKLLADLQSPHAHERALAVKKLAEQNNPEDLVLFTRAAKDLASIVRAEATVALGKSQDPRVVDLLGELLEDGDEDVQAKAAMALAQIKGDKSKAYLTVQYGRRGRSTRIAIVQALKASNVPGAMAQVVAAEAQSLWDRNLRALKDGALPERVAAAEELGKSGRAEAVTRLLPLIKDSQVILAAAAVRGLGNAGDKRAVGDISMLLNENYPELREAACEALRVLGDAQALPTLRAVALERSATSPAATGALLAMPRSPEVDAALCDIAVGAAPADALVAARELRARGGCPLDPLGDRLSKGKEPLPALIAARGLGPTAKALAPKVQPHLASNDRAIRLAAVQAVAELGDPALAPAVQKLYEQELAAVEAIRADWVKEKLPTEYAPGFGPAATGATADAPDKQTSLRQSDLFKRVEQANAARAEKSGKLTSAVRAPVELVDDATEEQLSLLAATIDALGALNAPSAVEIARRHANEPSPSLRAAALRALALTGKPALDEAVAGLLDADREVQGAVAEAMVAQGADGRAKLLGLLPRLPGDRLRVLGAIEAGPALEGSADPLVAILQEGGPEAGLAARIAAKMGAKGAVEPLMKYLGDINATARRDALWALGQLSDAGAAELVARDLYHDSADVRAAAADALARIGTEKQHESLDALKGDYYRHVRERAESALTRLGAVAEPVK